MRATVGTDRGAGLPQFTGVDQYFLDEGAWHFCQAPAGSEQWGRIGEPFSEPWVTGPATFGRRQGSAVGGIGIGRHPHTKVKMSTRHLSDISNAGATGHTVAYLDLGNDMPVHCRERRPRWIDVADGDITTPNWIAPHHHHATGVGCVHRAAGSDGQVNSSMLLPFPIAPLGKFPVSPKGQASLRAGGGGEEQRRYSYHRFSGDAALNVCVRMVRRHIVAAPAKKGD